MIRNYLILAIRRLRRQAGYAVINVTGLAVAMACCLLIGLYVEDELSYDRFHEHSDRLFTLSQQSAFWGASLSTPYPLASTLEASLPDVEHAVRTWGAVSMPVIIDEAGLRTEQRVLLTEPDFFRMFTFPAISGDPVSALSSPGGTVISETTARTYFGDENPIGRTLRVRRSETEQDLTVRAVVRDVPSNSTIQFDVAAPLALMGEENMREDSWGRFMYRTYVLTTRPMPEAELQADVSGALARHFEETLEEGESPREFAAHALSSVYLSDLFAADGFKGQFRYLYIFGSVAIFVLLVAAVNYVNLATARAAERAGEVGVRKALGAGRGQLVRQFLGESVVVGFAALLLGIGLTALGLPAFNRLFDKSLFLGAGAAGPVLLGLVAFVLLVAVAAGAYPALVLSRFRPANVLRGAGSNAGPGRGRLLRNGLVVLQFAISVVLIVGTAVIYLQLDYVQGRDLGFDGDQVVVVELPNDVTAAVRRSVKQQSLFDESVLRASVANGLPGQFNVTLGTPVDDVAPQARTTQDVVQFKPAVVDHDFLETLDIAVTAGRGFSEDFASDLERAYILNEAAAGELGWSSEEAVGKTFRFPDYDDVPYGEIIGVVENFHVASLHHAIDPIVLQLRSDESWSTSWVLLAKLGEHGTRSALDHIASQIAGVAQGEPFEYEFLDERFDAMYRTEQRLGSIFTSFAVIAILISCLGLFGLAAFTAQRRTKEIGIRKVLGASVSSIVALLSKDFLLPVGIALVVAVPVSYVIMRRWLEEFAYRIDIGPGVFLATGILALMIAMATVSYQSIKAAAADPVESLRYE